MPAAQSKTIGQIGEFELIASLVERFGQGESVRVGPGDDAAVLAVSTADVMCSLDMLVQNHHFRLDWSSAADVGHKAAAVNLSDINAMGGRATALLVGFGAPPDLPVSWALEFADGLATEAGSVGASVMGGDVTSAGVVTLAVTVLGECAHGVVRRSGARPGDVVALAGRVGWADAGYAVLNRGFRSPRAVVDAHRRPTPPYEAGPQAAALGATAMIDVSDGLLQDAGHVARASGVSIDLTADRFEVPEPLQAVGAALGVDPLQFVLTGGDDYGLVAAFPAEVDLPPQWRVVGNVLAHGEPGTVTVDGAPYDGTGGHQHFR